jgi:hypothetical protein
MLTLINDAIPAPRIPILGINTRLAIALIMAAKVTILRYSLWDPVIFKYNPTDPPTAFTNSPLTSTTNTVYPTVNSFPKIPSKYFPKKINTNRIGRDVQNIRLEDFFANLNNSGFLSE